MPTRAPNDVGSLPIDAVPLRHPGRTASAVLIVALLGLFLYGAATNSAYELSLIHI